MRRPSADKGVGERCLNRVFVFTDVRVQLDPFDSFRARHSAGAYELWKPYVMAFGSINLVARLQVGCAEEGRKADGPGVVVKSMPDYSGYRQFFFALPSLIRAINAVGNAESVFVGRLPEPLSLLAYARSRVVGSAYVALVVADPRQLLAASHPGLRGKVLGVLLSLTVRHIVARCEGVVYVTEQVLQSLYPCRPGVPSLTRSNVSLEDSAFRDRSLRHGRGDGATLSLVTVGTLQGVVKGHDTLIRAVRELRSDGVVADLVIVGSGRTAVDLARLSSQLGVANSVHFAGQVHDVTKLRTLLDDADVYVSGSRSEGLPRATVEAMARALPVVSTNVGGVPEIVSEDYLVPVDAPKQMATILKRLATDPVERFEAGMSNQRRAHEIAKLASPDRLVSFLGQFSG